MVTLGIIVPSTYSLKGELSTGMVVENHRLNFIAYISVLHSSHIILYIISLTTITDNPSVGTTYHTVPYLQFIFIS